MSTTKLNCPQCKHPVAWIHHSHRIRVADEAKVVLTPEGVEVTCRCGGVRIVTLPGRGPERRAA